MQVTLIDKMGNDLSVVNSARVSFSKESTYSGHKVLDQKDIKLLSFLARHSHWTPFAHTALSFRIKAPIYVARQLGKHQVGLVWNEVSRRYVSDNPTFGKVSYWRKKAPNVKQGSLDEPIELNDLTEQRVQEHYLRSIELYEQILRDGGCEEQARMVLPQSMETEWIWTGNLYAFHNVVQKRMHPTAQREVQEVAKEIRKNLLRAFPEAYTALGSCGNST